VSRGYLRGSEKITKKIPSYPQKENRKPLPSKVARLATKKRHSHPITMSLANSKITKNPLSLSLLAGLKQILAVNRVKTPARQGKYVKRVKRP
jgi:hypothetical protein